MSIDIAFADHVATITINRPERLNAMDHEHYAALSAAWVRVRDDPEIRVAVVTGAGEKSFSTGADLKTHTLNPAGLDEFWLTQKEQLLNRGLEVWKPVIAAVNGYCLAGGMTLLLATDIRLAAPHATFGVTEVTRGVIPGNGGTQRLLEQLPYPLAMEMLLTGAAIDADAAARLGLINRVVPAGELMAAARAVALKIAANPPLAVQAAKEMALRARDLDRQTGLRVEQMVSRLLRFTADAKEGPRAFAEKRRPEFKGR